MKDDSCFPTYVGGGDLWAEPVYVKPAPLWKRIVWEIRAIVKDIKEVRRGHSKPDKI